MTTPSLTDRERILTHVARGLQSTMLTRPNGSVFKAESFTDKFGTSVHFAYYRKPEPGDLVIGTTGGVSRWTIGWYVEPSPSDLGGALLREIGSDKLCNYSNERFVPIVGLDPLDTLEGDQYAMLIKVYKAFRKGGEYLYRFGGLDFDGDDAVIWIRAAFGGRFSGGEAKPFPVRLVWTKRTPIKTILAVMVAGGYGTREFERTEEAPAKPQ